MLNSAPSEIWNSSLWKPCKSDSFSSLFLHFNFVEQIVLVKEYGSTRIDGAVHPNEFSVGPMMSVVGFFGIKGEEESQREDGEL